MEIATLHVVAYISMENKVIRKFKLSHSNNYLKKVMTIKCTIHRN